MWTWLIRRERWSINMDLQNQENFRRSCRHWFVRAPVTPTYTWIPYPYFSPKAVKRMPINGRRGWIMNHLCLDSRFTKSWAVIPLWVIPFSLVLLVSDLLLILIMYFFLLCIFVSKMNAFFTTSQAIKYPYTLLILTVGKIKFLSQKKWEINPNYGNFTR